MKIKDIQLFDISRFRGEQMGMAMLFVILFHVYVDRSDDFFGLHRMGNLGVDIFLFLSGIGLWYSWMKTYVENDKTDKSSPGAFMRSWVSFYWRRLKRIYPSWLVVSCLYYIPRFNGDDWIDLFGDVLFNWDFWNCEELTFWYVPATMMLYIFAPPYMEMIRRHPIYKWMVVVPLMWCVVMQWVTPIHHEVGHLEIFWSRVPIFFIGINMGNMVRRKETIDGQSIWMILILFVMSLGTSLWLEQEIHGRFPLFLERLLYIPLTITTVLLLNNLFCHAPKWFNKSIAWFGGISLEVYLIHIEFVLRPVQRDFYYGYWPTFLLTVGCSIPLAWFLHFITSQFTKRVLK